MVKSREAINSKTDAQDWFSPVIAVSGSVTKCLNSVSENLKQKSKFVENLKSKIGDLNEGGIDRLTALGQNVKMLESTIRFRVALLQPDRKGSWFRESVASTGPFSSAILHHPVFDTYPDQDASRIQKALVSCWTSNSLKDFPFSNAENCIWGILLTHGTNLHDLNQLESTEGGLTIENCLDKLPPELESRYLRAFLMNVRAEYLTTKERLEECYAKLVSVSEKLWEVQRAQSKETAKERPSASKSQPKFENPAKRIRDDFRKRREQPRALIRTTADLEALKFMGFDTYPSAEDLKRRYLSLAKTMHPDRNGGKDSEFKMLTKSYELLLNRVPIA